MNTHFLLARSSLAILTALTPLGCGAHALDVGSTDGGSGGGNPGSSPVTYSGGCTAASCANATIDCAGLASSSGPATPEDVQCVPSPLAGQGSEPAGSCIVKYVCSVPGVGKAPDGGACPAWTQPVTVTPCPAGESCAGATASSASSPGVGIVSVELAPSTSGSASETTLSAYFTYAFSPSSPQTVGACAFDPQGAARKAGGILDGSPSPNAGPVAAKGPALDMIAKPRCDGTYAGASAAQAFAGGDLVSFSWSPPATSTGNPSPLPTTLPQIPAPHLVTLGAGPLDVASPALPRASDLAVAWTATGTPMSLEQVVVLFTQGTATVTCAFPATAGSGIVPADALLKLGGAAASYAVFSQHAAALGDPSGGVGWNVSFSVNAVATLSSGGLAKGTATLR